MSLSIQESRDLHQSSLMAIPGVVSVGIGRDEHGKSIIIVGVKADDPDITSSLPRELDGYTVRYQVLGSIKIQQPGDNPPQR